MREGHVLFKDINCKDYMALMVGKLCYEYWGIDGTIVTGKNLSIIINTTTNCN
jgi:hypothetical protein